MHILDGRCIAFTTHKQATNTNAKNNLANEQLLSAHGAGCYSCEDIHLAYRHDKIDRVIARTSLDHTGQANEDSSLSIDYKCPR